MVGLSLSGGVAPKLGRSARVAKLREVDAGQPGRRPGAVSGSRTSEGDMFLERHALASLPRYTSYPPANRFHDGVDDETYRGWLRAMDPAARLSLYLHVPFCRTLCWYCGCHNTVPNDAERVDRKSKRLKSSYESEH